MADIVSAEKRSWMMSRIKGRDTKPELKVRSIVHQMGYRFRLHRKDLPGNPDLVFKRLKKVIFVHGCFWHQHKNCKIAHKPSSNQVYWDKKLDGNAKRDHQNKQKLIKLGWKVLTIWECETRQPAKMLLKLEKFLV